VVAAGATVAWMQLRGGGEANAANTRTSALFEQKAKPTSGRATLIIRGDERRLVLSPFHTTPAPELYVHLVPGAHSDGQLKGGTRIALMHIFNRRAEFTIPKSVDTDLPLTVVLWCDLCHTAWGTAVLREPV
jgi:hypothetical protein